MRNSLRDQLLKAGLVDEKRANKATQEKRQHTRQARKARRSGRQQEPTAVDEAAEKARQERAMHAQRSRELNQEKERKRARAALRAELRKLLEQHTVEFGRGDIRYNFAENGKIKRIYVDRRQQRQLAAGELAIVNWDGRHLLVPAEVGERVKEQLPDSLVHIAETESTDPDDPYADFPIPDDLEW